jgi:dihydrofolate reductase
MTELVMIAAVARNGVIGRGTEIPWLIREDFRRFKALTLGHPCLMGDVTFRSLPDGSRPLRGRENVVLTLDPDFRPDGVTVFGAFDAAIAYLRNRGSPRAFVIGGASIYRLGMAVADVLEITELHREYEGDVRFPPIEPAIWEVVAREDASGEDRKLGEIVSLSYVTYRRKA